MPELIEHSGQPTSPGHESKLFEEAYATGADLTGKLVREAQLVGSGLIGGAIQEIERDPLKACTELALTAAAGTVLAAGVMAELPVIVTGAALTAGGLMTAKWLVDTFDPRIPANQRRNEAVSKAICETWSDSRAECFQRNEKIMQSNLGSLGMDLGMFAVGGGIASKFAPALAVEITGSYKVLSAAGRNLSTTIADFVRPAPSTMPGLKLALAEGHASAGRLPEFGYLSDYVNFCEQKGIPEAKSSGRSEPLSAGDSVVHPEFSKAPAVEEPVGTTRKAESEADLADLNRLQELLFAEDNLGEIGTTDGFLLLERPGSGVVGFANLGEQSLLYIGVLAEHRSLSKFLIKAVLDAGREQPGWWQSWLKESTAYPLFRSLARDGYIILKELGKVDIHPITGAKNHLVEYQVTDKPFTGERGH